MIALATAPDLSKGSNSPLAMSLRLMLFYSDVGLEHNVKGRTGRQRVADNQS